jgi:hypothetical protein
MTNDLYFRADDQANLLATQASSAA